MSSKISKIFLYGFLVALAQLLFINDINFLGYFNPKVYAIFLLLLPKNIKHVTLLFIGFIYGFLIDFTCHTYGIGMASSVFICLIKPYLFRLLYSKREDDELEIKIKVQGFSFIIRYLFIALILFHCFYFFVELGEIRNIFYVIVKSIASSALSILFYVIMTLMLTPNTKRK